GVYRIRVRKDAAVIGIMTFSMGFMEESIAGRKHIDFRFSRISNQPPPGNENRIGEEVVDMGYSSVRRRDVTNSVGIFDFKSGKKTYSSVKDMIREIPGINSKVFNMYGRVGPAIVVDGIWGYNINLIQPSMVESIVFLRDGSAAIYGSRGFGGVILIKTKSTRLDD
ncbi:MAG: TonB-dependent receptor plug domain-containing protein, partial [Bacteroidales bacterium]|nr:TonB-dependent receptor plug domain-containing protein [Bacteroidales bacterium]